MSARKKSIARTLGEFARENPLLLAASAAGTLGLSAYQYYRGRQLAKKANVNAAFKKGAHSTIHLYGRRAIVDRLKKAIAADPKMTYAQLRTMLNVELAKAQSALTAKDFVKRTGRNDDWEDATDGVFLKLIGAQPGDVGYVFEPYYRVAAAYDNRITNKKKDDSDILAWLSRIPEAS